MAKRKRRSFNKEFKAEAVGLCKLGDRRVGQVARDLDLTETALRAWVRQSDGDAGKEPPEALTSVEREELTRLRRENKRLQMERDILKAAAANSTGQCNFYRERFRWSHVAESLTRSHVHFTRHSVEVTLGVPREVGAPREVLAKEAVRVFVRATLPRAAGITEINLRVRGDRKALVSSEFGSTIPRERGHYPVGQMLHLAHDGVHDSGGVLALHLDQHQEARAPLD